MTVTETVQITGALQKVTSGESLSREEAASVLRLVMAGVVSEVQTAALLTALRTKGETVDEVAGFAEAMRTHAQKVTLSDDPRPAIDTCGTGGDGLNTFNVSTTAALVVAGAGVRVAKHGNRAASSQTGSADLLEALGAAIVLSPEAVSEAIDETCFGFMFAPAYHPAMKHVMPVRRGLGFPTVFNILGPISNPAGVTRQVIGVRNPEIARTLANVLGHLGADRVLVVTSSEGADELTLGGPNHVVDYDRSRGTVEEYHLAPDDFGLGQSELTGIRGGDAQVNAGVTRSILAGDHGPHRETVLLNAAAALIAAGVVNGLRDGYERAKESIDSGAAANALGKYVELSNKLAGQIVT
jgi:anthranilate phosphoribosyltransferase